MTGATGLSAPSPAATEAVDAVVAQVRERFGHASLAPAALVRGGRLRVRDGDVENPWDATGSTAAADPPPGGKGARTGEGPGEGPGDGLGDRAR